MAEPFVGEIKFFSFPWAPRNWALCDGSQLSIAQNQALFSLLGTAFGGNGVTTFGLPDLRGRTPMYPNNNTPQGTQAGVENVTLNITQLSAHNHSVMVSSKTSGTLETYENAVFAVAAVPAGAANVYAPANAGALQPMVPGMISSAGGNQAHTNLQPSLVGNFCIALNGIYPSRS